MHNKSLVLYLYAEGYRQKLICLITGYNQSFVSKNSRNPKNFLPSIEGATEDQLRRKFVLDRITECRVLRKFKTNNFDEQDKAYIKLLDFCLVSRDDVRKLYRAHSMYRISNAYRSNKEIIKKFDPMGLDIDEEDWQLFLK